MSGKEQQEDESTLVHNDELDVQPHMRSSTGSREEASLEHVNPALEDDDNVRATNGGTGGINTRTNGNSSGDDRNGGDVNKTSGGTGGSGTSTSNPPVYYNAQDGNAQVVSEAVIIRQPNGMRVIRTREIESVRQVARERPLKARHIKLLKVFSIVAIVLFFPLGIPALVYAFKCEKAFAEGIMQGNIDEARRFAKRCERLIIFAVMGALLVAVAVFAVVERQIMANDEEYWKSRHRFVTLFDC